LAKIAIVYYSGTGNTYQMARAVEEGAKSAGADVRFRRAAELASDAAIDSNPAWRANTEATRHVEVATPDDLEWADGFIFGTPTRFGLPSSQLKQFIDTCGPKWDAGKLRDKVAGVFGGSITPHGGQEATLLALQNIFYHWGTVIVPVGYTDPSLFAAGGNPYGVSMTDPRGGGAPEEILAACRFQGLRIARYAELVARNLHMLAAPTAKDKTRRAAVDARIKKPTKAKAGKRAR
jgi:NAD(P)H dehydrogenase (quinone)